VFPSKCLRQQANMQTVPKRRLSPRIGKRQQPACELTFSSGKTYPLGRRLNVISSSTRPCGAHGIQRSFLKIITSFARMTIEVLGYDIADLAEAGGGRNADVFAEIMEAFEYPQTHSCIEGLQLTRPP
jgi:hypothetical protein